MLDTTVLVPALGEKVRATDDPASRLFFEAMSSARKSILIAAPSLAEFLRKESAAAIPRVQHIRVVPLDQLAANFLGRYFPKTVLVKFRDALKVPHDYIKYDAMIVACAVRHRASVLVTSDRGQRALCEAVGMRVAAPSDYYSKQTKLAGI